MDQKSDFKVFRSDHVLSVGYAVIVVALCAEKPESRVAECFEFYFGHSPNFSGKWWKYSGIPRVLVSDEAIYEDRLVTAQAAWDNYAHDILSKKGSLPIDFEQRARLQETKRDFLALLIVSKTCSDKFKKIETDSECDELKKFIKDTRKLGGEIDDGDL